MNGLNYLVLHCELYQMNGINYLVPHCELHQMNDMNYLVPHCEEFFPPHPLPFWAELFASISILKYF